jgi:hypothetical protein
VIAVNAGPLADFFRRESSWDRVRKPLGKVASSSLARSGLTAGATMVVLSVASAATSAARRRQEGE